MFRRVDCERDTDNGGGYLLRVRSDGVNTFFQTSALCKYWQYRQWPGARLISRTPTISRVITSSPDVWMPLPKLGGDLPSASKRTRSARPCLQPSRLRLLSRQWPCLASAVPTEPEVAARWRKSGDFNPSVLFLTEESSVLESCFSTCSSVQFSET